MQTEAVFAAFGRSLAPLFAVVAGGSLAALFAADGADWRPASKGDPPRGDVLGGRGGGVFGGGRGVAEPAQGLGGGVFGGRGMAEPAQGLGGGVLCGCGCT